MRTRTGLTRISNHWKNSPTLFPVIGKAWVGGGSLLVFIFLATGCASPRALDGKVKREVERQAALEVGVTGETVADAAQAMKTPVFPADESILLDVNSVLNVATDFSRNLQNRRDDLYRAGLSLFGTRRNFGIRMDGTIEYVLSGGDDQNDRQRAGLTLGANRILPTGGRIAVTGSQLWNEETSDGVSDENYSGSARLRLDQPLLSGAGYTASHESLLQAERDYVYALRRFSLERQDFGINILREYYRLLGNRKVLENTRTNYHQFVFLRQRSEALFQVNRAPAIDVLRSQQEELSAYNRLISTEESYQIQVGRFLVLLGLPSSQAAELADDIPEMRKVDLDEEAAVKLALDRRMDLHIVRDQVEDARRKLQVARNLFLPEINAFGAANWVTGESERFSGQRYDNSWQAGVRAEIPLDRRTERDAVKNAELNVLAADRRLAEQIENVTLEVRESYSRLRSLTVSVDIQLKNIEIAEKRATNALLQFRNGRLSNRDVVEAANGLLDAQNAYVNALADYEIQRLTLLRQIGMLDVTREGVLVELKREG
ncbi:MAG TPA: TolC family protein [Kiritimatiellia bacterium]|nr:TolC family protein [Kiritimatiellia bacterium]